MNINPIKIGGEFWDAGYALDMHTSYIYGGYTRSEMGEAIYQLKYNDVRRKIPVIADVVSQFINNKWGNLIDFIFPVPPSSDRELQPVYAIAEKVSEITSIPVKKYAVKKIKKTPQLKEYEGKENKKRVLQGAFEINVPEEFTNKNVLIFDDIFGSGATMETICEVIRKNTKVNKIFILTLTKNRKRK